jgi:DNA polymerase I-like protein with 3'-5' exonuclease and polymerase domains
VAKVCVVIDKPGFSARAEGKLLSGYESNLLYEKAARVGLLRSDIEITALTAPSPVNPATLVYLTMGEKPLNIFADKKSIWKWHLSPLDYVHHNLKTKVVPTFDFAQMNKDWTLTLYFEMALRRATQNATPGSWVRKEERYVIGPDPDEAIERLRNMRTANHEWLSIDIETGRGQINTFGVATSGSDALAVKVLPGSIPASAFFALWSAIRDLCESDIPKVMQNGIYERTYLSRYGIAIRNFKFDTMVAQKFLWPELEKGLDNVGRIYTMEPYWKDDGRLAIAEGKQKDWGNIRDWERHFVYNCRDTTNTLIAAMAQRRDLQSRGMLELYDGYISKLFDCVAEMGINGLPLNDKTQADLIRVYEERSLGAVRRLSKPDINPRSPKQKLKLLKEKGYEIPTKRKTDGTRGESTDELSLKRLRIKHPHDTDLQLLLEIAGLEKALSSYLHVETF